MSKKESISRYSIIINTLRKRSSTFKEIQEKLALESELQDYDFNISKRTFQRDVKDINSIYSIAIQYDFSLKTYFIDFEDQQDVKGRVLEAFDIFNALNISDRLSNHIHFEQRKPQGTDHLFGLLHAIKNNLQLKFTYYKFWEDDLTERSLDPYALKEFKNRWYVVGNDPKNGVIKSFALDRLSDLVITNKKFYKPNAFQVNQYYKNSFGIISPNEDTPEDIVLSFTPFQGKYIKTLPLHHTQHILRDTEDELRISLKLYITHDFFMEILSLGDKVKVIQPEKLKKQLVSTVNEVQKLYK